jgi:hypothetical protein
MPLTVRIFVGRVANGSPVDRSDPATLGIGISRDGVGDQFIELGIFVDVVRVSDELQSFAEFDALPIQVFQSASAIQAQPTLRVGVVKVGVDTGLAHGFRSVQGIFAGFRIVGVNNRLVASALKPVKVA